MYHIGLDVHKRSSPRQVSPGCLLLLRMRASGAIQRECGSVARNDRPLSGRPRQTRWDCSPVIRPCSFDRAVRSEPLAFAVGAVIRYGISMGARWLVRELPGRGVTVAAARTPAAE